MASSAAGGGGSRPSLLKLPNLKDKGPTEVADLFLESEGIYVNEYLRALAQMEKRLRAHSSLNMEILKSEDITEIFLSIPTLYDFTKKMYNALVSLRFSGNENFFMELGTTLKSYLPFLKVYVEFVLKTKNSIIRSKVLSKENAKFRDFLLVNELTLEKGLPELQQCPTDRLSQYIQYLAAMLKGLPSGHVATTSLEESVVALQKVLDEVANKAMIGKQQEGVRECMEVLKLKGILDPSRRCMYKGELIHVETKSTVHVYLFNDFLITSTKGLFGGYSVKDIMLIPGILVSEVPITAGPPLCFRVQSQLDPLSITFQADSDKTKAKWVKCFTELLKEQAETLEKAKLDNRKPYLSVLHPDEFKKMIQGKPYDEAKVVPRPNVQSPQGFPESKAAPTVPKRPNRSVSGGTSGNDEAKARPISLSTSAIPSAPTRPVAVGTQYHTLKPAPPVPKHPDNQSPAVPTITVTPVAANSPSSVVAVTATTTPTAASSSSSPAEAGAGGFTPSPPQPPRRPKTEEWVYNPEITPETIGPWSKLFDEDQKQYYYENIDEEITQWLPPQCYLDWRPAPPPTTPTRPASTSIPPPPPPLAALSVASASSPSTPNDAPPLPAFPASFGDASLPSPLSPVPTITTSTSSSIPPPPGVGSAIPPPPGVGSSIPPPPGLGSSIPPPPGMAGSALPPPPGLAGSSLPPPPGSGGLPPPPGAGGLSLPPPPGSGGLPPPPSNHNDLMNAIRGGASLRKAEHNDDASSPTAGDPTSQLMAAIRSGASLKKAEPIDKPPLPMDDRSNFLAAIRQGTTLKKAQPNVKPATPQAAGLAGALQKSLAKYRKFVQDDDEDEDSNNDDDDW